MTPGLAQHAYAHQADFRPHVAADIGTIQQGIGGLTLAQGLVRIPGLPGDVAKQGMMAAIRTILLADLVMSLDNVIAVAAAAGGNMLLLILGLAISIPLVIFGSTLMIKLMERFPVIVVLGAALLGWVAGETITSDHVLEPLVHAHPWLHYAAAAAGALLVVGIGKWLQLRVERRSTAR